jgi:hypothetical protein
MSGNGTLNLEMKETNYVHFSSPEPDAFLFAFPIIVCPLSVVMLLFKNFDNLRQFWNLKEKIRKGGKK